MQGGRGGWEEGQKFLTLYSSLLLLIPSSLNCCHFLLCFYCLYPIGWECAARFQKPLTYMWPRSAIIDDKVAFLKIILNTRVECKSLAQFMIKMALKNPVPLGVTHTYIAHLREYPPGGGVICIFTGFF